MSRNVMGTANGRSIEKEHKSVQLAMSWAVRIANLLDDPVNMTQINWDSASEGLLQIGMLEPIESFANAMEWLVDQGHSNSRAVRLLECAITSFTEAESLIGRMRPDHSLPHRRPTL